MTIEMLVCYDCKEALVDGDLTITTAEGHHHRDCYNLAADTTWDRPMAEHEAEYNAVHPN